MQRSKSRSGYSEFRHKKQSSFLIRSISGSKICRGDGLTSQVDKQALVSVDRKSISLSENRIVKAAMMEKQISNLEEELKITKQKLNEAVAELQEAKELANTGLSGKKAEELFSDLKSVKDSLLNSKKEIESRDKEINLLKNRVESAKVCEDKLAERDASLERMQKKIQELEKEVEKTKQSESNMLESLMIQTQQITQTKMDLEESKQEIITLYEQLDNLQTTNGNELNPNPNPNPKPSNDTSQETKALKDEITNLKNELKLATEGEEKSKKAMDDLASALSEVATEATTATENLKQSEKQVTDLKSEIEKLKKELKSRTEESERARVEHDEALLTWTAKENGFMNCIRKADEENASFKHENKRLQQALVAAETNSRNAKDESSKLRDILKQAINESNASKESSNIARAENSDLKDLLVEKEESLHFLTKENEQLRINEVAAHENVKEFKRLLSSKPEPNKHHDDNNNNSNNNKDDVFNSPLSSPQRTFSFDFDEMKANMKKDEEEKSCDTEEEYHMAEIDVHDDPEKAEALKGSIFDSTTPPKSGPQTGLQTGPQTPRSKGKHSRAASGVSDSGHHHHTEDQGYMYNIYNKRKLVKKFGDLLIGKAYGKKEGSMDQGKEHGKDHGK